MKAQKLTLTVAIFAVLSSAVACGGDSDQSDATVVCQRTEEFVGKSQCGYYVNGLEWVWNSTPSPSAEQAQEDEFDIDKPKKKKTKTKSRGRR